MKRFIAEAADRTAAATAAALGFAALLAVAGCGLGAGPGVGAVHLTVTRDYGAEPVLSRSIDDVRASDTVMRVLDRSATITTRFGGDFVQSIDGTEGGQSGGRSSDWFFYVNGIEATVGAGDRTLDGGERIWWDYRDWTDAISVPAVVGSYPAPFASDGDQGPVPVAVECRGGGSACATVRDAVAGAGADVPSTAAGAAVRVLVGPWASVRTDPAAAAIESGPSFSGVFAKFERRAGGYALTGLSAGGGPERNLGAPARASSPPRATTRRRRSGWSPAPGRAVSGPPPGSSTPPTCAIITRSPSRAITDSTTAAAAMRSPLAYTPRPGLAAVRLGRRRDRLPRLLRPRRLPLLRARSSSPGRGRRRARRADRRRPPGGRRRGPPQPHPGDPDRRRQRARHRPR